MVSDAKIMTRAEYAAWVKNIPANVCVFCKPNDYPQLVLYDGSGWQWIAAKAPYWKYHTMLVPKKHYEDITELSPSELQEMQSTYQHARNMLRQAKLKYDDGQPIYMFSFAWRIRDAALSKEIGVKKPSHLHLHLYPDREKMLDPIMDPLANTTDFTPFLS